MTSASNPEKIIRSTTVINKKGLHARASAKFVKLAGQFDAEISVKRDDMEVAGTSIMGLMMLAASPGCEIEIAASGPQAQEASDALIALIEGKFEED